MFEEFRFPICGRVHEACVCVTEESFYDEVYEGDDE